VRRDCGGVSRRRCARPVPGRRSGRWCGAVVARRAMAEVGANHHGGGPASIGLWSAAVFMARQRSSPRRWHGLQPDGRAEGGRDEATRGRVRCAHWQGRGDRLRCPIQPCLRIVLDAGILSRLNSLPIAGSGGIRQPLD